MNLWYQLVNFGFRLLYNEMAWTYDLVSWVVSLGEWRRWQFAALEFVEGQRVLEIAHGTGHLLPELTARHQHVVGMDLSPAMGRIASGRLGRLALSVPLLRSSAMTLPFAAGSFDSIVTTFPTSFVVDEEAIEEFGRILPTHGRLIIVPSGSLRANGPLERLIDTAFALTGQTMDDSAAQNVYQTWQTRFAQHGFNLKIHQISYPKSTAIVLVATPAQE